MALKEWFAVHQAAPTLEQLAKATGRRSAAGVSRHLRALRDQGFLSLEPRRKQSIVMKAFDRCPTCGQDVRGK